VTAIAGSFLASIQPHCDPLLFLSVVDIVRQMLAGDDAVINLWRIDMPTIARILLLSGIACFGFNGEASATYYCNIHHNCPDKGRIMNTAGFSKTTCKKKVRKAVSWGDGPASARTTCENIR
jgi:hypothetical protein